MTPRKQHVIFNLPNNKELLQMKTDWLKTNETASTFICGACFTKQDEIDPNVYQIVDVTATLALFKQDGYRYEVTTGAVDVTSEWIKKEEFYEIFPNNLLPPEGKPDKVTVSRLWAFHKEEFKQLTTLVKDREGLIKELKELGINI
ncbi:hypothetical protein [Bacillus phage BC-T25]|nr:hypothetical protein [Bacillus phage BC-T25]